MNKYKLTNYQLIINLLHFSYFCSWRIQELLREFPETCEIEPNEIYSVTLKIGNSQYSLLLNLPPAPGPNSPPILFCDPVIPNHSMVSRDGQVQLMEGMGMDGDLVTIIRRIQQEASRNQSISSDSSSFNVPVKNSYSNTYNYNSRFDLSLIDSLTDVQVNHLLTDEEKFLKFFKNYKPIFDEKERVIEGMREELIEMANSNINLKKEIDALSTKLGDSHEKYSETLQSYQNFLVLNSANISASNPENLLTQIQVNLMELNDLSNEAIKKALNSSGGGGDQNNLDLELKECVNMRKEYHKKAILLQKLHHQQ